MADFVTVDIPLVGPVDFPASMPPEQMAAAAKKLHDDHVATFAAANAKPLPPQPTLADEFTPAKMWDRGVQGLKGEAKGFAGGLAAVPLVAGYAALHPIDAAEGAKAALSGAGQVAAGAIADPGAAWHYLKGWLQELGGDPESIGKMAGGVDAALAAPSIFKAAEGTRLGAAITSGISDAANKIPGVAAARKAFAASSGASKLRTPGAPTASRLVLTPEEIQRTEQLYQAMQPNAQFNGMFHASKQALPPNPAGMDIDALIRQLQESVK